MKVVATAGATRRAKLQSNHHYKHTNTQLFTGCLSFLLPNQQCQSTEERNYHIPQNYHIPWTCSPKLTWGSSILVLTTKGSWIVREDCHPLISPPMAVPLNIKKLKYIKSIKYTIMVAYNAKKKYQKLTNGCITCATRSLKLSESFLCKS